MALGIWFRKSPIDGWLRRLGQIATYIATSSARLRLQAMSARRWSCRVLTPDATQHGRASGSVVGQEGLLQLGLRALEVGDVMSGDFLQQRVQRGLRRGAGQDLPGDLQITDGRHESGMRQPGQRRQIAR